MNLVDAAFDYDAVTEDEETAKESEKLQYDTNTAIANVTRDLEARQFNTAIAELMKLTNSFSEVSIITETYRESLRSLLILLAPMAPHVTSELWQKAKPNEVETHIHQQSWPIVNESALKKKEIKMVNWEK